MEDISTLLQKFGIDSVDVYPVYRYEGTRSNVDKSSDIEIMSEAVESVRQGVEKERYSIDKIYLALERTAENAQKQEIKKTAQNARTNPMTKTIQLDTLDLIQTNAGERSDHLRSNLNIERNVELVDNQAYMEEGPSYGHAVITETINKDDIISADGYSEEGDELMVPINGKCKSPTEYPILDLDLNDAFILGKLYWNEKRSNRIEYFTLSILYLIQKYGEINLSDMIKQMKIKDRKYLYDTLKVLTTYGLVIKHANGSYSLPIRQKIPMPIPRLQNVYNEIKRVEKDIIVLREKINQLKSRI